MGITREMQNAVRMQVCEADKSIQKLGAHLDAGRPLVGLQDVPAQLQDVLETLRKRRRAPIRPRSNPDTACAA